jgi:hypothetical protein
MARGQFAKLTTLREPLALGFGTFDRHRDELTRIFGAIGHLRCWREASIERHEANMNNRPAILVTADAGAAGYHPIVFDNFPTGQHPKLRIVKGELLDRAELNRAWPPHSTTLSRSCTSWRRAWSANPSSIRGILWRRRSNPHARALHPSSEVQAAPARPDSRRRAGALADSTAGLWKLPAWTWSKKRSRNGCRPPTVRAAENGNVALAARLVWRPPGGEGLE